MYIYTTKKEVTNCLIIKKIFFKKYTLSDYDLSHGYVINLPVKILFILRKTLGKAMKKTQKTIRESNFFMTQLRKRINAETKVSIVLL